MDFLDEDSFIAQFQARLKATRLELGWTHEKMAHMLGTTEGKYKKYENRAGSAFPVYLLPALIYVSGKPYFYWAPDIKGRRGHIRAVK